MNKKILTAVLSSLLFLGVGNISPAQNHTQKNEGTNLAFTYAYNNKLNELRSLSQENLRAKDRYGFTVLDYANIHNNDDVISWVKRQGIHSGVDRFLVRRMQIWLYTLNYSTDNMLGIYNEEVKQNIFDYQKSHHLPLNSTITPDWFYQLEKEALLNLQSKLRAMGYDAPYSGLLDEKTSDAFKELITENDGQTNPLFTRRNLDLIKLIPKPLYLPTVNTDIFPVKYLETPKTVREPITAPSKPVQNIADIAKPTVSSDTSILSGLTNNHSIDETGSFSEDVTTLINDLINEPNKATTINPQESSEQENRPIEANTAISPTPTIENSSNEEINTTENFESTKTLANDPPQATELTGIFDLDKQGIEALIKKVRSSKVLEIQTRLKIIGFFPYELDGMLSTTTKEAIRNYQKSIDHKPTALLSVSWEAPLEKAVIFEIQKRLKALGYYHSVIDGIPGGGTVIAMNKYKNDKKITYKGEFSTGFLLELFNGKVPKGAAKSTTEVKADGKTEDKTEDKTEIKDPLTTTIDEIVAIKEPEIRVTFEPNNLPNRTLEQLRLAYIGYFHGLVDGKNSNALKQSVSAFQKDYQLPITGDIDLETRKLAQIEVINRLQRYLKTKGYFGDSPSGALGPKTRNAIQEIKQEHGIYADQKIDVPFMLILIDEAQNSSYLDKYLAFIKEERKTRLTQPIKISSYQPNAKKEITFNQLKLGYLGYYHGTIDGNSEDELANATKAFQTVYHLTQDGAIGKETDRILIREAIIKFQNYLKSSGYMSDDANGILGPKTRSAITKLKQEYQLSSNYEFDSELLLILIDKETGSKYTSQYRLGLEQKRREKETLILTQKYLIGLNKLSGKADGIMGKSTTNAIESFQKNNKLTISKTIDKKFISALEKASIKQAQMYLKNLSYKVLDDGIWGKNTEVAMNSFLKKHNKTPAKKLDADILLLLKFAVEKGQAETTKSTAPKDITSTSTAKKRAAMPSLKNKGQQISGVLSAAPSRNTFKGKLQIIRNQKQQIIGCKVASTKMDGHWCTGRQSGQQCTVLYKNNRVLSMRCK